MDKRLTDRSLTQQLIIGLPFQYDDIVTTIRANKSEFQQAIKILNERERTIGQRKQSKALVAKGGKGAKALVGAADNESGSQKQDKRKHWKKNYYFKPYHQRGDQQGDQHGSQPPRTVYDAKKRC